MQALKFNQLVKMADGVVVGTVLDVEVKKARNGVIYRYVTLGDLEVVTGRYGRAEITLRFEGGALENEALEVHGSPEFADGERVVLFVDGNGRQITPVVGWEQGVFRVQDGARGGQAHVTDAVGNRVFRIQNDRVVKEKRFESEAQLIGPSGLASVTSDPGKSSFGVTELGERAASEAPGGGASMSFQATLGEPMSLDAFLAEVREEAQAAGSARAGQAPSGPSMATVEPDQEMRGGAARDAARSRAIEPEEPLEQGRARGRLPRPILPSGTDEPDLE